MAAPSTVSGCEPGIVLRTSGEPSVRCTLICVSNRADILADHLLSSAAIQDEPHDFILCDSNTFRPRSAAHALNTCARYARGRWLIFAHQDVDLETSDFLRRFCDAADTVERCGILGIVGVDAGPTSEIRLVNQITVGAVGATWRLNGRRIAVPEEVETVDELLFAVTRAEFEKHPLDEDTCPHWDLYGVDYCLSARARGLRSVILPLSLRHQSVGKVRGRYYETLARLTRKHRGRASQIYTTCGTWRCDRPVLWQRAIKTARAAIARGRRAAESLWQPKHVLPPTSSDAR